MRRIGVLRLGLVLALLAVAGCTPFGRGRAKNRDAIDEEASFIGAPIAHDLNRPVNTDKIPAAAKLAQPAGIAAPGAKSAGDAQAAERTALIDDTLARLKTVPGVTPEQYAECERTLKQTSGETPILFLRQFNAMVKLRQKDAPKAAAPAVVAQPAAEKTPAEAQPEIAKAPPVATVSPAVHEMTPPQVAPRPKRLAERLRQAKLSAAAHSAGIFGGTVDAAAPDQPISPKHTMHKPADLPPALEPPDADDQAAARKNPDDTTWQSQLAATIAALQTELQLNTLSGDEPARHAAYLRLLSLVAGQRDAALREIDGLEPAVQDYWKSQLHSLAITLAADGTPVQGRRAAMALRPLREAVDHLANQATLDVRNIALCTEVTIWGNYTEFAKYEFRADQEVLLYFEVENFTAEETAKGHATEFISSYEIFDSAGRRVAEQQFPVAQETCKNRRHDYFIRYHLHIPKQLSSGEFTLQLTVEDQKGHKFGQGSVKFKVVSG